MENSNSRIEFTQPKDRESAIFLVGPDVYNEGKIYASQLWVSPGDVRRAKNFVRGEGDEYGDNQKVMGYAFLDREGQKCLLVGDGHHRIAMTIAEGKELPVRIDANVQVTSEMLSNPNLAAQKLAVLGINGIWPFKEFMKEFIEVRVNLNGSRGK